MNLYNMDGSVLMEIQTVSRNGNNIEFSGTVMGAMPVKGSLSPEEARRGLSLIRGNWLWLFLLSFIFRRSKR
ncbi:MAG: hypothetical protein HOC23_22225 [Halieaceae bacterium]|jgi:hypothetical protein|nr:hypothetical protein [Halieaceae bacterium]